MSSILPFNDNMPKYSIYGENDKSTAIIFTFFFVLFFALFLRSIILGENIDSQNFIILTIIIVLWYGLSVVISDYS
jgi:hypothetical protein